MNTTDYQKIITVNKPTNEVYNAITRHIADWWSNDLTGAAAKAGDSFNIAFNNTRKTFEIKEAIPNNRVVWKCTKAYIDYDPLQNKSEWVGTEMIWNLSHADNGTTLTFVHDGLNQELECYDICESGWNHFIKSLE